MPTMLVSKATRLVALCWPLAFAACGGKDVPPPDGNTPQTQVKLSALKVSPDVVQVAAGLTLQLSARGTFSDGSERDLTNDVTWSSSDASIATISNEDGSRGLLRGLAQGTVQVRVEKDGVSADQAGTVAPAALTALSLAGADAGFELPRGGTVQLSVSGAFTDATNAAVDTGLTWRTSDPAIATVSDAGLVTGVAVGDVTISVTHGDLSADLALKVACVYPGTATAQILKGGVMPALHWDAARRPDGTTFAFDMKDVYCNAEYADYKVVFFVVGAGWCPNCPRVVTATNRVAADIEAAKGLLVYTEIQDDNYNPSDSTQAHSYIQRLVGTSEYGIRVGDRDIARPANLPFNRSPEIRGIPFIMAVRIRDMKYITDDRAFGANFPFVEIANNPDAYDMTAPPVMCMEGTEEASEPNDTAEQAATIAAGDRVQGGICAAGPDFFWVDVAGPWHAQLTFTNNVGDLDMYVWDTFADRPLTSRGQTVGSNGSGDTEQFDWQGPSLLRVEGYQGGQGPYTLEITAR